MSFKRKNPGNQSIRRQLTFYMGLFVVLPLCLALMLLNFYLQKVTTENKINNETDLLSQIRDNTDQKLEAENLILYHTEDKNISRRKELYTEEGRQYYKGNLWIPDDLETYKL